MRKGEHNVEGPSRAKAIIQLREKIKILLTGLSKGWSSMVRKDPEKVLQDIAIDFWLVWFLVLGQMVFFVSGVIEIRYQLGYFLVFWICLGKFLPRSHGCPICTHKISCSSLLCHASAKNSLCSARDGQHCWHLIIFGVSDCRLSG